MLFYITFHKMVCIQQVGQKLYGLNAIQELDNTDGSPNDRLDQIRQIITEREQKRFQYDDSIVRQMIECIKVYPNEKLEIIFGGGYIVEENLVASS